MGVIYGPHPTADRQKDSDHFQGEKSDFSREPGQKHYRLAVARDSLARTYLTLDHTLSPTGHRDSGTTGRAYGIGQEARLGDR